LVTWTIPAVIKLNRVLKLQNGRCGKLVCLCEITKLARRREMKRRKFEEAEVVSSLACGW
jgi:hypothetical protein